MTLAETYALQCGVKLPEEIPTFPGNFFPLPYKYITLSPKSGQKGKDYDHFALVVNMLHPILEKYGIHIVQLGAADEPQIEGTYKYVLKFRQAAEAVKNSLCHISVDTMTSHLAGMQKTPLVELFGTTSSNSARPHYLDKHILLSEVDYPSFEADENPKSINLIKPEKVANAALEILNLPERIEIETKFIGLQCGQQVIELIPNIPYDYQKLSQCALIVRMDQCYNEEILLNILRARQQPLAIFTKKPLSKNIPIDKIAVIRYFIDENSKPEDYKAAAILPVNKEFTFIGNKEKLQETRRKFGSPHDFPVILNRNEPEIEIKPEYKISTQRLVLSGGMVYCSVWHAKNGINKAEIIGKGATSPDFTEGLNYYYLWDDLKKKQQ